LSVAQRFFRSGILVGGANLVATALLVVRSVALARLLPVEVFGIYAFAAALTTLTAVLARFGMDDALIHRAPQTDNIADAAAIHGGLAIAFAGVWAVLLLAGSVAFFDGQLLAALIVLTGTQVALLVVATPEALLRRRVQHRLLATIRVVAMVLSTAVGLVLAVLGHGLWALLMIDAVAALVGLVALGIRGPSWRPRLSLDRERIGYFLRFGSRNVTGRLLEEARHKLDKLWTGWALGPQSLGHYARASAYGTAPADLLNRPINSIVTGVYAELAHDRQRLSGAVARISELLFIGASLLAVCIALVAPDLIVVLIGAKWLPMLDAFRIMLVAAVLTALNRTFVRLFVAVGAPALRVRVAALQVVVLLAGILMLGSPLGIVGVAVSVLASALAGLVASFFYAGRFTDLAAAGWLLPPVAAAAVAWFAGDVGGGLVTAAGASWLRVFLQGGCAATAFFLVMIAWRGRALDGHRRFILRELRREGNAAEAEDAA
jgi:O-antigen/teichoic acid export membrane protein